MKASDKYFHVFVTQPPAHGLVEPIFSDLNASTLRQRFLRPYERGEAVQIENEIVHLSNVSSVAIVRTDLPRAEVEALIESAHWGHLDDLNRDPSFVHIALPPSWNPDEAKEYGADVTSTYVKGAPGSARSPVAWLNNPWIVALGAGIILLLAGLVFGG